MSIPERRALVERPAENCRFRPAMCAADIGGFGRLSAPGPGHRPGVPTIWLDAADRRLASEGWPVLKTAWLAGCEMVFELKTRACPRINRSACKG